MDEPSKYAYRCLIHWGLCNVRSVYWQSYSILAFTSPIHKRRLDRHRKMQGATADWLHNLALFLSLDFERFDEERFWSDYERLHREFGEQVEHYRRWFESRREEANKELANT